MDKSLLVATVGLSLVAAVPAHAATVFEIQPDLVDQTGDCVYNTTCSAQVQFGDAFAAQSFDLAADTIVNGFGFNAILTGGGFGTAANYRLFSADADGAPGTLLSFGSSALANSAGPTGLSFATTNYTFNVAPVTLAAGAYVLAFQNVTNNFSDYLSKGAASSGAFTSTDGGNTFFQGYRGFDSVAISVFGDNAVTAAVPEPATWLMMLFGFGAMGAAMRVGKRRQKTTVSYA